MLLMTSMFETRITAHADERDDTGHNPIRRSQRARADTVRNSGRNSGRRKPGTRRMLPSMCSLVSLLRRVWKIREGGGGARRQARKDTGCSDEHRGSAFWTDILLQPVRAYRNKDWFVKRTALMSRYRSTGLREHGSASNSLMRQSHIVKQVGSKLVSPYLLRSLQSRTCRSWLDCLAERDSG